LKSKETWSLAVERLLWVLDMGMPATISTATSAARLLPRHAATGVSCMDGQKQLGHVWFGTHPRPVFHATCSAQKATIFTFLTDKGNKDRRAGQNRYDRRRLSGRYELLGWDGRSPLMVGRHGEWCLSQRAGLMRNRDIRVSGAFSPFGGAWARQRGAPMILYCKWSDMVFIRLCRSVGHSEGSLRLVEL
jgi:hypothetical protein